MSQVLELVLGAKFEFMPREAKKTAITAETETKTGINIDINTGAAIDPNNETSSVRNDEINLMIDTERLTKIEVIIKINVKDVSTGINQKQRKKERKNILFREGNCLEKKEEEILGMIVEEKHVVEEKENEDRWVAAYKIIFYTFSQVSAGTFSVEV